MSSDDLEHQKLVLRAAVEQELESGVLANEDSPRLSSEACLRVSKRRVGRTAEMILSATFPHILNPFDDLTTFLSRLAPNRPKEMIATYQLELTTYAAHEFNILADEYGKFEVRYGAVQGLVTEPFEGRCWGSVSPMETALGLSLPACCAKRNRT